jgi:hypothetical protein
MRSYLPLYRNDESFIAKYGKRKAFHKGGNSSCRVHIRQHYSIYKTKCEKEGIAMKPWAIPRPIWKTMQEALDVAKRGEPTTKKQQQQLQFLTVTGTREFTRAGTLHAITKLIATNNQVNH